MSLEVRELSPRQELERIVAAAEGRAFTQDEQRQIDGLLGRLHEPEKPWESVGVNLNCRCEL